MDIFEKLYFEHNLRQALKAIKDRMWAIDFEMKTATTDKKKYPPLNPKLEEYWDTLFTAIPPVNSSLLNTVNLNQKVSLSQWIKRMAGFSQGKLLGQSYHWFLPPSRMEHIKIWGRLNEWYLSEEVPSYQGDSYWYDILRSLENWKLLSEVILEGVVWNVNQRQAELELTWVGPFESITELNLVGPHDRLWTVSFKDSHINEYDMVNVTSFLINTQFITQKINSHFMPVDLSGEKLATLLQVPRADMVDAQEVASTPSKTRVQQIIDFIINLARPHYLEASRQLEAELSQEIKRWQEIADDDHKFAVERLQQVVLDQIVFVGKTFFGD